jgi:hypothetical protein
MFPNGAISIDEKIYLSNKTLINAKDLKVGDKILSLKILDSEIYDFIDIYNKYIALPNLIKKFELCEAQVYSIFINESDSTNFIELNKNPIKNSQYIGINNILHQENIINSFILMESYIATLVNTSDKIIKLNPFFSTEQLNVLNIFSDYDFNKTKNKEYKKSSIALNIVGGHFYFTENFVVFSGSSNI